MIGPQNFHSFMRVAASINLGKENYRLFLTLLSYHEADIHQYILSYYSATIQRFVMKSFQKYTSKSSPGYSRIQLCSARIKFALAQKLNMKHGTPNDALTLASS